MSIGTPLVMMDSFGGKTRCELSAGATLLAGSAQASVVTAPVHVMYRGTMDPQ